jgi:lipopolysaccharide export system protein LptA
MSARGLVPAILAFALVLVSVASDAQQRRPAPAPAKSNADEPIEITADSLEVQQDKQIAIFRGRVQAVQGTMRLTADTVTVTYRDQKAQQPQPQQRRAPTPAAGDGAMGAISRIDAVGNVFVSSPAETAQGQSGVYDVDKRTVTLVGQVVLTRDKNVLKGETLVWNLETGVSRLDGGPATAGTSGGRVKGVFMPQERGR